MIDEHAETIILIILIVAFVQTFVNGLLMGILAKSQEVDIWKQKSKPSDQQMWTSVSVSDKGAPDDQER